MGLIGTVIKLSKSPIVKKAVTKGISSAKKCKKNEKCKNVAIAVGNRVIDEATKKVSKSGGKRLKKSKKRSKRRLKSKSKSKKKGSKRH